MGRLNMKFNYVLEYKEPYIINTELTKNITCQTYRWKQLAVAENKEDLEPYLVGHEYTRRIVKR